MEPKEKADQLVDSFKQFADWGQEGYSGVKNARECAILMVEQIITNYEFDLITLTGNKQGESRIMDNINYWDLVISYLHEDNRKNR